MMQGYVWIVIAIMKKMYMIYKMHKETFCFVTIGEQFDFDTHNLCQLFKGLQIIQLK